MPDENGTDQNLENSAVKQLIAENETQDTEEQENLETEEEVEETTEETENDSELANSEITEELAQVLGLPKSFVGKPLSEAGKSYRSTVNWESKNNRLIKNLEGKIENLQGQISESQQKKIESQANKETEEEFGDIPDPVTEPKKFNQWLAKRDEKILEKLTEKINKSIGENPVLKQSQEFAAKELERMTIAGIQGQLPEGVNAGEVIDKWLEDNEDDYESMMKSGIYKNKPQLLIKHVISWYKANSFDSLKNSKESDLNKQVHKKVKENLLKKSQRNSDQFNNSVKPKPVENENSVVGKLIQEEEQAILRKTS